MAAASDVVHYLLVEHHWRCSLVLVIPAPADQVILHCETTGVVFTRWNAVEQLWGILFHSQDSLGIVIDYEWDVAFTKFIAAKTFQLNSLYYQN